MSSKNEELQSYVDLLAKSEGIMYKGKDISDAKKKSKTLKCFMSRVQTALWFADSFGLDISSVNVCEKSTEIVHTISTLTEKSSSSVSDQRESKGFDSLSQEEKEKVKQILFLLNKFYVSDEFYHDPLPKSYLVKQRRNQLNNLCSVSRTPGESDGCQVDLQEL